MHFADANSSRSSTTYNNYNSEESCGVFDHYLHLLRTYYLPTQTIVGLIGNFLSCLVFLTTHLKMRSSSYYLAALAVADFAYLIVIAMDIVAKWDGFHREGWCQVLTYTISVASMISVWLIVAFTVERFIAIHYPLKKSLICTVSRSKTIVSVICGVTFVSQTYVFWTAGVVFTENRGSCAIRPEQLKTMIIINAVDFITTFIIPFILIVVLNVMIARSLFSFSNSADNTPGETCLTLSERCSSQFGEVKQKYFA